MTYMKDVGNLQKNRDYYLRTRFPNLTFLFKKRFSWMNDYIHDSDEVLEVGCGIGITKLFLNKGQFTMSDVIENPWIDRQEDALNLSYADNSLDVIIANNIIHHLASPLKFFQEANRALRPGGKILIQDVYCSFFLQRLLRLMKIEDYNFSIDVFDINEICTYPENPWDGNNAIPTLLFNDVKKFEHHVSNFKVIQTKNSEFLIYILSGGISGKTFAIPLPFVVLKLIDKLDGFLVFLFPQVFALQMRVILQKK